MSDAIEMVRGDSRVIKVVSIKDEAGVFLNLSGAEAWLTIKKSYADSDAEALLQKHITTVSSGDGVVNAGVAVDFSDGYLQFDIAPSDTDDVVSRKWKYDIQIKTQAGDIYTVKRDTFTVDYDVTRATV